MAMIFSLNCNNTSAKRLEIIRKTKFIVACLSLADHQLTDIAACTGAPKEFTAQTGTFFSDLFDGVTEYPNNLNCQWKITAPAGKVITLWFNVCLLVTTIVVLELLYCPLPLCPSDGIQDI